MEIEFCVNKWHNIAFCTDPIDRSSAEPIIGNLYKAWGFDPPNQIVWCNSPFDICNRILGLKNKITNFISNKHGTKKVITHSYLQSMFYVSHDIRFTILQSKFPSLSDAQLELIMPLTTGRLMSMMYNNLWRIASFKSEADTFVSPQSFFAYLMVLDYWKDTDTINIFTDYEQSQMNLVFNYVNLHYIYPTQKICYASERPCFYSIDAHNDSGPVVAYRDGFKIYAINGIEVDEQVVMRPETQTLKQIQKERNKEVQRIRIERYGWEKYLGEINAKVIDTRRNDIECTQESLMETSDNKVLVCHCPSTGRIYTMEVPAFVTTCQDAQTYLWSGNKLNSQFRSNNDPLGASINRLNILGRS